MAGGVYLGGRMSQGVYVSDEPYTDRPIIPVDQMEYVDLKFGSFVSQKRIFHDGYSFRTRDVITHVSNKLGGVHFDPSRRSDVEVALDRAASYCLLGNPTGETDEKIVEDDQRILIVLPKEQGYVWNCLDVEMLAAAQSFMNLKIDSQKFLIMGDAPERT